MKFLRSSLAALGLSATALVPLTLSAQAVITWGSATNITGDSDVATNGTATYAYNLGALAPAVTINGVQFQTESHNGTAANFALSGSPASYFAFGTDEIHPSAPFELLPADSQSLLAHARYYQGASGTLTLQNLTLGATYQVQLWVNDSRNSDDISVTAAILNRQTRFSDGTHFVSVAHNLGATTGSLGQYVTGTFVATGSMQNIFMAPVGTGSVAAQLNAFSVSQISAIPEPSTYAAFAGLGALGLAVWCRRRRV